MSNKPRSYRRLPVLLGIVLAALLWLPLLAVVSADFSFKEWRYSKPVTFPSLPDGEELVEVDLDRDVFQGAARAQVDLRLVEASGREVAYQLVMEPGGAREESLQGKVRDLGHVPGQHSSFVVDLGRDGQLHNRVKILTGSKNFQRKVTVEGSPDAQSWAVLREGLEIFDFTVEERRFNARNLEVDYPESTARYLRIRITNNDEEPLRISGAKVSSVQVKPAQVTGYDMEITGVTEDASANATVVEADLGTTEVPTNRLTLQTVSVNFHREVSLEGSEDGLTWTPVSRRSAIYAYDTAKFTGKQLGLSYPEVTYRYLRATIHNEDNPPLSIDGIEAEGLARRVLFLAQPGETYSFYYGNPAAGPVSYDLANLLPYLDAESPLVGSLGAQTDSPQFTVPKPPFSERFPWLITVGVAAAAVVMALLLFGFLKQAKKSLPPPGASAGLEESRSE